MNRPDLERAREMHRQIDEQDPVWRAGYEAGRAEVVAQRDALAEALKQYECETCGHAWSRHTSGGMCTGQPPEGSECYCVLFPPDPVVVEQEKEQG